MNKKGSALMQVLVIGLIIAAFSVLMLRYAITRSANLSRSERILETEIMADSCMDQYMSMLAYSELSGTPISNYSMDCAYYPNFLGSVIHFTTMTASTETPTGDGIGTIVTHFTLNVNTNNN